MRFVGKNVLEWLDTISNLGVKTSWNKEEVHTTDEIEGKGEEYQQ
jgi:hypothetical protein